MFAFSITEKKRNTNRFGRHSHINHQIQTTLYLNNILLHSCYIIYLCRFYLEMTVFSVGVRMSDNWTVKQFDDFCLNSIIIFKVLHRMSITINSSDYFFYLIYNFKTILSQLLCCFFYTIEITFIAIVDCVCSLRM